MAFDLSNYSEQDLKRLDELQKEYERLEARRGRFPYNLIDRVFGNDSRRWWNVVNEWADITGSGIGSLKDKTGNTLDWYEVKREQDADRARAQKAGPEFERRQQEGEQLHWVRAPEKDVADLVKHFEKNGIVVDVTRNTLDGAKAIGFMSGDDARISQLLSRWNAEKGTAYAIGRNPEDKERNPQLDKCLEGQPFEVRSFMERFHPANETESALYNYMVKTGHIDDVSLATIADPSLIRHLWENHQDSQDYSIRKAIMENPRCSRFILEQGLSDHDWEVRKAAIQRPELSQEACIQRAKREGNPMVKQALQERLGAFYPTQPEPPVPLAAMQARARTLDGRTVAVHAGGMPVQFQSPPREEVPNRYEFRPMRDYSSSEQRFRVEQNPLTSSYEAQRQQYQEVRRKLPLDEKIKGAQQKSESQVATLGKGKTMEPVAHGGR